MKRVTCSSPRLPSAGTEGTAIVVSRRDAGVAVLERVLGAQQCHGCFWLWDCAQLLRAAAICRCWELPGKCWLSCYSFLGGLGKGEACRSIITPCFPTRCHCTIASSLQGRRGMCRSSRQAGDVTLWTQTTRKCFLGTHQHCIMLNGVGIPL